MDAKTRDSLLLLSALSLFCASVAWTTDHAPRSLSRSLPLPFSTRRTRRTGADMDPEERKDTIAVVALVSLGVILMLVLLALAVGPLMMR
jgi:hypothetical protein